MDRNSVRLAALIAFAWGGLCAAMGCPGPEPQAAHTGGGTTGSTSSTSSSGTPSGTGTGASCSCLDFDVLFVVDNTHSFWDLHYKFIPLTILVGPTIQELLDQACSLHVGVVTATPQPNNPDDCQELGDLSRNNGDGDACEVYNGRYLTENDTDTFADSVVCLLYTGLDSIDGDERPIEALFAALDPERNAPGACNDGFLRDDAPLVVVIISDADDRRSEIDGVVGADDPDDWFEALVQLKGGRDRIAMIGIIGPIEDPGPDAGAGGGAGGGCNVEPGVRLRQFIENNLPSHSAILDVCDPDATMLTDAIEELGGVLCPADR